MPKVVYVSADGEKTEIDAVAGESVMETAKKNGVSGIVGECGGALSCSSCHVYVSPDWQSLLPEVGDEEDEMLDGTAADRTEDSRLSCQIRMTEDLIGLVVTMPDVQQF